MENQMTALRSVSIEEETLSVLLVEALKNLSPEKYQSAADSAADAVKSAFSILRCKNAVGQMTMNVSVNVDEEITQALAAINKKTNILADSVSKAHLRMTELATILSQDGHPRLMGL